MADLARIIALGKTHDVGLCESYMTNCGLQMRQWVLWLGLGNDWVYNSTGRRIVIRDYWRCRLRAFCDWVAS